MSTSFELQPTLKSPLIELRPLRPEDFDELYAVASDPLIWEQHPIRNRYELAVFKEFFRGGIESGGALIAIDPGTGKVIGTSRYHDFDSVKSQVEVGFTFLSRAYWGGRYNGEMKRLMLEHAFRFVDTVVFRVGPSNFRSRKAVEKLGAIESGKSVDGTGREHVVYRLAKEEFLSGIGMKSEMPSRQVSRTAFGTAYMRAAHQLLDPPPRILDDPAILKLLGKDAVGKILQKPEEFESPARKGLRSHVLLRSRYAEDRLAAAVRRGVNQYVVLGAGLDTFALRQPAWAGELRIVEVDHEATQDAKKRMIKEAGLAVPPNVSFAAIDFEHETLIEGLLRNKVAVSRPTFFSWLGVTMYLNEEAIDAVLGTIAQFPKESEVVLTFARSDGPPSPFEKPSALVGETWLSHFTLEEMEEKLRRCGFAGIEFLSPDAAKVRYFEGNGASLPAPRRTTIVSAIV